MAQVPYSPVPGQTPSDLPAARFSIQTPMAAFGGEVAAGLGQLGQGIEKVGDVIYRHAVALKDLENDTAATQKAVDLDIAVGERHAKFSSLEGDQQVKDYPNYVRDLKAIHQKMREELPNDEVKRKFDARTLNTIGRTIFNGAGSAGTQAKKAADDASEARIRSIGNRVFQSPMDDVGFQKIQQDTEEEVIRYARLKGMEPDKMDELLRKQWSLNIANRIMEVAKVNVHKAKDLFEENKLVLGDYTERVEKTVQNHFDVAASRDAVIKEFGDDDQRELAEKLPKSRDEYIEGAQKKVRQAGGSPVAERLAAQQAGERFDLNTRKMLHQKQERSSNLGFWLEGGGTGNIPLSTEGLINMSPEARDLYVNSSTEDKHKIEIRLRANRRLDREFTDESRERYLQLRGMATGTGTEQDEFMSTDIWAERHFPVAAANELRRMQDRIRQGQANFDPRVNKAMTTLKPWLAANNFNPNKDAVQEQMFRGALQEALNEWQAEDKNRGKKINNEELQGLASDIYLRQVESPRGYYPFSWLMGPVKSNILDLKVPEDFTQRVIDEDPEFARRRLDPDSDAAKLFIRDRYIRTKYIELLKSKGGKRTRMPVEESEE
jgi:hypothetical protein